MGLEPLTIGSMRKHLTIQLFGHLSLLISVTVYLMIANCVKITSYFPITLGHQRNFLLSSLRQEMVSVAYTKAPAMEARESIRKEGDKTKSAGLWT